MTCDMWYATCDMWQVRFDMWHVVGGEIFWKFQVPSSEDLGLMILWRFGEKGLLTDGLNEGVWRTAPATPGLLISRKYFCCGPLTCQDQIAKKYSMD